MVVITDNKQFEWYNPNCWAEYTVENSGVCIGYIDKDVNSNYKFISNINESGLISFSIFELEAILNFIKKLK